MFTPSVEMNLIFKRLTEAAIDETITYDELTKLIGINVRTGGYRYVKAAREKALREKQMVFEVVSKVGIRRLSASDVVDHVEGYSSRIRKASRKAFVKLTSINDQYKTLSREKQLRHNLLASVHGAIAHMTTEKTLKRVEAGLKDSSEALPVQKTLEAFREG